MQLPFLGPVLLSISRLSWTLPHLMVLTSCFPRGDLLVYTISGHTESVHWFDLVWVCKTFQYHAAYLKCVLLRGWFKNLSGFKKQMIVELFDILSLGFSTKFSLCNTQMHEWHDFWIRSALGTKLVIVLITRSDSPLFANHGSQKDNEHKCNPPSNDKTVLETPIGHP